MRGVVLMTFIAATSGLVIGALNLADLYYRGMESFAAIMISLVFLMAAALQVIYVLRIAPLIQLRDYKESDSLDDFFLNQTEIGDRILAISYPWKAVNFISSFIMTIWFMQIIESLPRALSLIASMRISSPGDAASAFFPIYFVSIPFALIFNLNTFNLRKIRE